MIEQSRNNPTFDLIQRIANALNIEAYELFFDPLSPNIELEKLRQDINNDMKKLLDETLEKALSCQFKKR